MNLKHKIRHILENYILHFEHLNLLRKSKSLEFMHDVFTFIEMIKVHIIKFSPPITSNQLNILSYFEF